MAASNRGKYAEGQFRNVCKVYEAKQNFAFHRYPDAHSGSMVSAPADFKTLYQGKFRLIEVKETEETNRLPRPNFKKDQAARMRLWELAGAGCWVIVLHTKTKLYRCFKTEDLAEREGDDGNKGSWFFEPNRLNHKIVTPRLESKSLLEIFKHIHGMEA